MARGTSYLDDEYIVNNTTGRQPSINSVSIAQLVLDKNGVRYDFGDGSPLTGYDIKAQDCVNMLKLSLLATIEASTPVFKEVYCKPDGVATVVKVGETVDRSSSLGCLLHKNTLGEFNNKIDHVLVKAKQELPIRSHGGTLSLMGNGFPIYFGYNCGYASNNKNNSLGMEAWAEFERSMQSEETQNLIRTQLVQRSKWQQLVGYKATFAGIPRYASMSISQVTPREAAIPFTNTFDTSIDMYLGNSTPDAGGVFDISNVNALGSQVVSIERGDQLLQNYPDAAQELGGSYGFTEFDYYILLDHECSMLSISRGQNWFVLPSSDDHANVVLRASSASLDAWNIYYGFDVEDPNGISHNISRYFFRRRDGRFTKVSDGLKLSKELSTEIAISTVMFENPYRGEIVVGLGGNNGLELSQLFLHYSISKPSIQIRSPYGDAPAIAATVAAGGVYYSSIVITEKPAGTGWNQSEEPIYPPTPPDLEGESYDVDSKIDELEGSVVDMAAPFLSDAGAVNLAHVLDSLINETGTYHSYVYAGGGYNLLPGHTINGNEIIQSIEFTYADKDSVTTNITTGPKYYPVGSYSDSQYVKRSESITRTGLVVAGSNKDGIFIVEVEGRGRYEAILGTIEPVYPGDRVELKIMNVPIEKD